MPFFVGGIDSKYTVLYIQKISGFNKDLTQLQPILSSSPSKTQTKLHLPIQEITAGPSFYVTWHKWFPYTIIWEIWLGIDLPIPHSPLPPCLTSKKLGTSGWEMDLRLLYCTDMFWTHINISLKFFYFFGQPWISLCATGSLAEHNSLVTCLHIANSGMASPRSWQLSNRPLTSASSTVT